MKRGRGVIAPALLLAGLAAFGAATSVNAEGEKEERKPPTVAELLALIVKKTPDEGATAQKLRSMKDAAVPDLRKACGDADAETRKVALRFLLELAPVDSAVEFDKALVDAATRIDAIQAAAGAKAKTLVPTIQKLLSHEDAETKHEAAYALFSLGEKEADGKPLLDLIRADMESKDPVVRGRAADLLAETTDGDSQVLDLLRLATSADSRIRESGAKRLLALKEKAVPGLRTSAKDAQAPAAIRRQALTFLAEFAPNDCADDLSSAFKDADGSVRAVAVRLAAKTGAEELLKDLSGLLAHADAETRREAVYALVSLGETKAAGKDLVDLLLADLSDKTASVRWKAAEILGDAKDARAEEALVKALSDESALVRGRACGAVRKIKSQKAVDGLISLLDDDSTSVQEEALAALRDITGQRMGPEPDEWKKWQSSK